MLESRMPTFAYEPASGLVTAAVAPLLSLGGVGNFIGCLAYGLFALDLSLIHI